MSYGCFQLIERKIGFLPKNRNTNLIQNQDNHDSEQHLSVAIIVLNKLQS